MSRTESGLFSALEEALRTKGVPLDCHQLFEIPAVRRHAATANRVSDYLGNMWRKGLLTRMPAARTDRGAARWMYQWREDKAPTEPAEGEVFDVSASRQVSRLLLKKPTIEITEHGNVITIDLPSLVLTIKTKP